MGLEMAAQDMGHEVISALSLEEALDLINRGPVPDVAVLDVNLGVNQTCAPVAMELAAREVPFVLHSGAIDRNNEVVRSAGVPFIPKPAMPNDVIELALQHRNSPCKQDAA
ncbi:response regulator [Erythrobacter sp. KY5]|nr:response regulator [Erythrobacter sp. KY5]